MKVSGNISSTKTGSVTSHISRLIADAKAALAELPRWERYLHIIWLAGPFILLIERSPADIWLSALALTFVVRSVVRRDGWWLKKFWVRAAFAFWAVCFLSAALSPLPAYSMGEVLVWFRFPLFAMATAFGWARQAAFISYDSVNRYWHGY